ncbi:MAG TPA: hypothetical protein VIK12_03780 [Pengzhenrongella sp.]|jgi:hypothetical protein
MGRHAGPPDPAPEPIDASPGGGPARSPRRLIERLALAAGAAGTTGAVMGWAGAGLDACLLGAAGTGAVVLVAAFVAGSLPDPPHNRRDVRPGGES